jgi:hypothetical protein
MNDDTLLVIYLCAAALGFLVLGPSLAYIVAFLIGLFLP